MASTEEPAADEAPLLEDMEPRTPMKRLGSTRKLAAFNNIRVQLAEQSRVLEARAEATAGVVGELQEYCRRRAELEQEYSRALDKMARAAAARHRDRPADPQGPAGCWRAALGGARALARDHAALAALYGGALAGRLARAADDAQRLHRKCRDLLAERHDEVAGALAAAHTRSKLHAAAHHKHRAAALKLRAALDARADPPKHRKVKALDKEVEKRRTRHAAARADALRARAEYALALEAANATLQRYYLDDVGDVILAMEVGLEAAVGRCARVAAAAEAARGAAAGGAGCAGALRAAAAALDALADRQRLLDAHAATFALPRPLPPPPPADGDAPLGESAPPEGEPEAAVRAELARRLRRLDAAARALRAECRENAKTLDAAEDELVKQMEGSDEQWDVSGVFGSGGGGAGAVPTGAGGAREDQEDYYLAKFRAYVSSAARLARLETGAAALRGGGAGPGAGAGVPARRTPFGAPLELRLPRVVTECVRVVAAHGLRHQGVFRVSGSHAEIAALRAAFERGEEPLASAGPADVNSVCGLLKLYLRELRPPLLPPQLQERLVRVAALPDDASFCARLRSTLQALPLPALLVLRYLFAFLAHLARHSRDTCMDAWNLAVCLGPTLLPAWGEPPHQLHAQNQLNELVKRTILLHEQVFPQDVAPHALYRPGEAPEEGAEDAEGAEGEEGEEGALEAAAQDEALCTLDETDALSLPTDDSDTDEETSDEGETPAPAPAPGPGLAPRERRRSSGSSERQASTATPVARQEPPANPAPAPAPAALEPAPRAPPAPPPRRLADSTPDLVLDLPERLPPSESADSVVEPADSVVEPADSVVESANSVVEPAHSIVEPADSVVEPADYVFESADSIVEPAECVEPAAADSFAHNRDTLRKRSKEVRASAEREREGAGPGAARTTLADLPPTGGCLKPPLAARPAVLPRRPTPHPRRTPQPPHPTDDPYHSAV